MAYTTINKSTDYFNTKLYTGNSSTNAITGVGFQPDWVWMKNRGASDSHYLYDAVRGVTKSIYSNLTTAEATKSNGLTAFGTDGFTLGNEGDINGNGNNFVSWNWKANGAVSENNNNDGQGYSTVSANTTAGFSIVKYTGTGSNTNFGHGLGVAPKMIIVKNLSDSDNWVVYHQSLGNTDGIYLNTADSTVGTNTFWNNTTPTTTVFSVGTHNRVNGSSDNMIAYCFAEKTGYSKFGSYTGNGNADGTFVYTGFKPRFFISKRIDSADNWSVWDSARDTFNEGGYVMEPDTTSAEWNDANFKIDFVSNGVKIRNAWTQNNNGSGTYIFMAFGQSLVGTNGVTAKAR